ncbi:putative glyoxalase superfamily protein PhnB [Roseimicrobium gellanilyticum]|uniref:Putative glyoxalase superfamily protein PhnB n=1 Tax=Roseimicrobium gellanilyticum TaxID=748857 RepID=A0A366H3E6_9BACT|nr:VOC family protein [Roseimicrobium gellanilyticum]RBP35312.1 putative glyoxalase superfamily protein PhnB [Roseimicrobium gellanilyticum]
MKAYSVTPVFQVSNLDAALKHYTEVLGFTEDFRFGEYAGVRMGDACLHLCAHRIHNRPVGGGTTCIFCDEVDDYCARIKALGAHVKTEPQDYPYGMRDFMVVDPDGNHLSFGCAIGGG